jgi:UPF0176 protein
MSELRNRLSKKELKEKIQEDTTPRNTLSFYKYFPIAETQEFRDTLFVNFDKLGVYGRVYVASEGINAQINVPSENLDALKNYIYSIPELDQLRLNIAYEDNNKAFYVLKIKVRKKIVADGIELEDFNPSDKGTYLKAKQFNELAKDEETVIVDMRNHYEYEVGHFKNAIEVPSDTFRDQLPMAEEMLQDQKDKNIIMYCTGGIRCEKASAYLKYKGFKNVYHVEGGIINYANQAKELGIENYFVGRNFVFDDRMAERISNDIIANCHQCGEPHDLHTNCANSGCHLLFLQCDSCKEKMQNCCSQECMDILQLPEEEQKKIRQGKDRGIMIFNKSKDALKERFEQGEN